MGDEDQDEVARWVLPDVAEVHCYARTEAVFAVFLAEERYRVSRARRDTGRGRRVWIHRHSNTEGCFGRGCIALGPDL